MTPNRSLNRTLHSIPALDFNIMQAQTPSCCSGPVSFDVSKDSFSQSAYPWPSIGLMAGLVHQIPIVYLNVHVVIVSANHTYA